MIKSYSEWGKLNEVDELTEPKLVGKYINGIIQTYDKAPSVRPSRNVQDFMNAKATQPLGTFMRGVSGRTSAEILEAVIDDWYKWPSQSEARSVIISYINNDDDLSNLAAWGLPFGKVLQSDPTLIAGLGSVGKSMLRSAGNVITKSASKGGRGLFSWVPKMFRMGESNSSLNEAGAVAAVAGVLTKIGIGSLLSATTRYALYGKESLEDDLLFSWTTPYLPDVKGLVGDDPIISTYVSVFNTMMMIVYDSWNLCMGQERYGNNQNPIMSWQNGDNYISAYYKQFYESDPDIKSNFVTFMNKLKAACLNDMKHPSVFQNSPFYYTGDNVRVNFDNGESKAIPLSGWYKWLMDNYKKYSFIPVSKTEFIAKDRKGTFSPLSPVGINDAVQGDPTREVTLQFPDGSISNLSVLELEIYLANSKEIENYEVETQNITTGGSSIILKNREGAPTQKTQGPEIPVKNPSIVKGSTFDEIGLNIQAEDITSFVGMGDV
jgi:hypothetical protein